jgi:hypothetical protein
LVVGRQKDVQKFDIAVPGAPLMGILQRLCQPDPREKRGWRREGGEDTETETRRGDFQSGLPAADLLESVLARSVVIKPMELSQLFLEGVAVDAEAGRCFD